MQQSPLQVQSFGICMRPPSNVREAYFHGLAAAWPGTAAERLPLVMYRDAVQGEMPEAIRHRDFFSLYIVRQGRGTHVIDGVPYGVARGDVYAMGLGMAHHFADCDHLATDTLHFAPAMFDRETLETLAQTRGFQSLFVEEPLRRGHNGGRWLHLTPEQHAAVTHALAELRAEWASGTPEATLLTRALFLRLLIHLARHYAESQEGPARADPPAALHEATVAAAVRYLDAHFAEPLRISEVAASVFLSPDRFTEVFSQAMGRPPRDYLAHLRLERAKALLAATDKPIADVGLEAGFGDAAYFTRAFRTATGLPPRDFRRRMRR